MKTTNVCKFPTNDFCESDITSINFVLENDESLIKSVRTSATYILNYVRTGTATLVLEGKEYNLLAGDVFFITPGVKFFAKNVEDFSYYYISFLGKRAQQLMDKLSLNRQNPVRQGIVEVGDVFKTALVSSTPQSLSLICESVILFTFGAISNRQEQSQKVKESKLISDVRLYVDKYFDNDGLTLKSVSEEFSYNPKYLSSLFTKIVGESFSSYLTKVRINYAQTLISQGHTSVKDIAFMCGFKDPLYFSKVFKRRTGKAPSELTK